MAVRYALQAELGGLTLAQRNNGAAAVQNALDSDAVTVTEVPNVQASKVVHGDTELFVDANFTVRASIDRVFLAAFNWASTRAETMPSGRRSYVRLRAVDPAAQTITERYAESPGWVDTETELPWNSVARP